MSAATFRPIPVDDVQPGMRISRGRSFLYRRVTEIADAPHNRRFLFDDRGPPIQPRRTVTVWLREERD